MGSRMMGMRTSAVEYCRTECASELPGVVYEKKGSILRSISKLGSSVSVRVKLKNFGPAARHCTSPSDNRSLFGVVVEVLFKLPAQWASLMLSSTVGTILCFFSVANVRSCNSVTVVGGGVPGNETMP